MKAWFKGGIIGVSLWFLIIVFLLYYCAQGRSAALICNVFLLISQNLFLMLLGFSSLVLFFVVGGSIAEIFANVKETPQEKAVVRMTVGTRKGKRRVKNF